MDNHNDLLERMRSSCDFFLEFGFGEMSALLKLVSIETHHKGDIIFCRNDPAASFYIIIKGSVEIFVERDGSKHTLTVLKEGSLFGEMGILFGHTRTASARAAENTQLFNISESKFKSVASAALLAKIYKSLARIVAKRAADLIGKQRDEFIGRL
ncbi:MAG: cyclic nucleotide-binding domain-containing protein [Nitrospinae bacterium]|nr:cyclic nucleotide-binding domain-containing protein [Nitrospinota bacterium]